MSDDLVGDGPLWLPVVYAGTHSLLVLLHRNLNRRNRIKVLVVNLFLAAVFLALIGSLHCGRASGTLMEKLILWGPVAFFWWAYLWTGKVLSAVHAPSVRFDPVLIGWEARFGQPSLHWARRGGPWTTEVLHLCCMSYFAYVPAICLYLDLNDRLADFQRFSLSVCLGYLVAYSLFALVPVEGPRWALVDKGLIRPEERRLRGFRVTRAVQHLMYEGPVHRGGAMPSSHSSTALIFLVWCWRIWGLQRGLPALFLVAGMLVGAIYGRYHYLTDVIAGLVLGAFSLWAAQAWLG
ncbi:MAG TPA: phosphatase PAP2 family protein [Acidobacteriota bacterium]|nr:phosphatase PAP2 family protein [Acidobacteriota bacterium]